MLNALTNRPTRPTSRKEPPSLKERQRAGEARGTGRRTFRWLRRLEDRFDDWLQGLTAGTFHRTSTRWPRWLGLETLEDRCVLAAPVVTVLPIAPQEGLTFNGVVANVVDPGNNEPAADYTALINWGDGSGASTAALSGPTGGPFTVSASHTYAEMGQYPLTVAVTNNGLTDTWTTEASMPTATYNAPAAGAGGLLYIFGGGNSSGYLNTVQAYNPTTNTWTSEAPLPSASWTQAAVAGTNGLIYVFGGSGSSGNLNTVQVYNPSANTWTTAAPMPIAGSDMAATIGANGIFYVFIGASGQGNMFLAFNPNTNTWTTEAPLPTASTEVGMATGANGLIYIFGGSYGGGAFNTVEAYDPATNTWTSEANMLTATTGPAAVTGANGLIYVFGGANSSGALNTVQAYDPATNTWATEPSMPAASEDLATAAGANGQLYTFGGFYSGVGAISTVQGLNINTGSGSTPIEVIDQAPTVSALTIAPQAGTLFSGAVATFTDPGGTEPAANYSASINWGDGSVTDSNSIGYNSGTGVFTVYGSHTYTTTGPDTLTVTVTDGGGIAGASTWTTVASLPTTNYSPAAASASNGLIYVFGGYDYPTGNLDTVEAYNPATNTWTTEAPMPTATVSPAAAAGGNGLLYVFGGQNSGGAILNTVQAYNPVTNTWTTEANMPTASYDLAAATGANGLIYVFGGNDSTSGFSPINTVQVYNPATNFWTTFAPMPTASEDLAAAAGANGLIYVFGGDNSTNGFNPLNTVQEYNPATNTWTTAANMPTATMLEAAAAGANGLLYVFGGYNGTNLNTVQAYNPATDTWTTAANMPTASDYLAAATGANGSLYVFGGIGFAGYLNTVQAYQAPGASASATITEASPPNVTVPSNQSAREGSPASFALGSFTDPRSSDSPWLVNINWGDGSGNSTFDVASMGSLGSLAHTYASYGTDTVTISVTDNADVTGSASFTISVADVPSVSVVPIAPQEGLTFNGVVANVTDSGTNEPASDYSALITWGDGSGVSTAALSGPTGGPFTVSSGHTYAQMGQYPLAVTVTNNALAETWTTEANMPTPSSGLAAAAGPNGLLYVFGGQDGSTILNTVQAYNPSTNTWTTEDSMPTASTVLAAATGANGLIYVFGGENSTGTLNTVQAYNPATNTWTTEAPMPNPSQGLAAATGANGLIYVFGGYNGAGRFLNTTQVYNPSTNTWTTAASMPTGTVSLAAAASTNGLLYVFGGADVHGDVLNAVEAYNPSTNTWTTEASMPTASQLLAAATGANGLLYVFGGENAGGAFLSTVQAYNATANTWTSPIALVTASAELAAAAGANGLTYVFGGNNGDFLNAVYALGTNTGSGSTPIEVVDQAPIVSALAIAPQAGSLFNSAVATFTDPGGAEPTANYLVSINWGDGSNTGSSSIGYNASTGVFTVYGSHTYTAPGHDALTVTVTDDGGTAGASTWTTVADMPTASSYLAAATGANGMLYVFGGYAYVGAGTILNTVQAYNPVTNTWTTEAPMPTASGYSAAATGANGLLYVFGGANSSGILNTVQAYNPATNFWTTEAPMPSATSNLAAATGANGLIYVFGGGSGTALNTVQAYNPATNAWTTEAPMPTASEELAAAAGTNGLIYVFGGFNSHGVLSTVQAYNPATNTWTTEASMPTASYSLAATASSNGLIYVFGGFNGTTVALNTVQAYNPVTNTWTTEASMPTATANLAVATSANGLLYVFGGSNANGVLNTVQAYQAPGASGSSTITINVAVPPVLTAPSNQGANEGSATTFALGSFTDASSSDSPWLVNINWGDGSNNSTFTTNSTGSLGSLTHTYTKYGTDTVTETVTNIGNLSASASFTINVANLPPVVTAPSAQNANEGSSASFALGSFIDPGSSDSPWLVSVNWGDGSSNSTFSVNSIGSLGSLAHAYATYGTDTVTVTVTDSGQLSGSASFTVMVADLPPVVTPPSNDSATQGITTLLPLGSFTDPGSSDSPWLVSVNWGDGSNQFQYVDSTGSLGSELHAYATGGIDTVTVTVTDSDNLNGSATFTVDVPSLLPVVSVLPIAPREGLTFNGVVANVTDPGINEPATDYSALINWGDGSNASTAALSGPIGGPFTVNGGHTYAAEGPYSVSVSVTNNVPADTWTTEQSMPTGSDSSAAAAGANGLIYVFGGDSTSGTLLNVVQAYNPAPNALNVWTTEAPLPTASEDLAAATGANGLLYVFGGTNGSNALNTVEAYNPATNTWTTEAPLPTAREGLAAVSATNGLIYTFGGLNSSGYLNTVEAYNPVTNTWTTEAPMPIASANLAAAAGVNGLLYVFGGGNSSGYLNAVQAYNPATNTWTTVAGMPTPSASLAAAAGTNGLLYVFGGFNNSGGFANTLSTAQVYNPLTNTWTTATDLPLPDGAPAAAAGANGLLYVFGGDLFSPNGVISNVEALNTNTGSGSTSIEVFDQALVVSALPITPEQGISFSGAVATFADPGGAEPIANYSASISWGDGSVTGSSSISYNVGTGVFTVYGSHTYETTGSEMLTVTVTDDGGVAGAGAWTSVASMPTASADLAVVSANGLLYTFGGLNSLGALNTAQAYNPATNSWTSEAPMPTAAIGPAAVAGGNGLLYVFGGSNSSGYLNTVEAYNPATNTWTTEAPMPTASENAAAAAGPNGLLYVFGGNLDGNALNTVQAYNPATNTWTTEANMLTASEGLAAAAGPNGLLYVFGGSNFNGGYLNTVQAYNPANNTWTTEAPLLTAGEGVAAAVGANGLLYVFGGYNGSSALNTVQAYNPATNTWTSEAPLPTAGKFLAAVTGTNDMLYVFGGQNSTGQALSTSQAYQAPGASGSVTITVNIAAPPVVTAPSNQNADEGSATAFALGSFTDPRSSDSPWLVNVNWGDGSSNSTFSVNRIGSLGSLTHTYATYGTDTVTVTVTDSGNVSGSASFAVDVASLMPIVSVLPIAPREGLTFNGVVANVTDPGNNELPTAYTALINWGDGTGVSTAALSGPPGGPFTVTGSHTYAEMGQYSLTVSVTNNALADTWTTEAPLPFASYAPAAASAGNGLLYVFGGYNSTYGVLSTVQAYNPATNTWTTEADMPTASNGLAAAAGANGLLYVFGGSNTTSGYLNTVQAYNPVTNTWTTEASMPIPSAALAAAAGTNGLLYVFGGANTNGSNILNTVQAYNPVTNTWTTEAPMPIASEGLAAAAGPNGLLYVFGGANGTYGSNILNTVQAYNPATNTWTTEAPMPTANVDLAAASTNGLLYVFGGANAPNAVQAYNPATNTWTTEAPMATPSFYLAAAAGANGLLYVFGGQGNGGGGDYLNTVQALNTHTGSGSTPIEVIDQAPAVTALAIGSVSAGTAFSGPVATFTDPGGAEPVANYSATINWSDGSITGSSSISYNAGTGVFTVYGNHTYTAAGHDTLTVTVTDDGGIAGASTWITVASMPTPSYGSAAASADGLLYVFGGISYSGTNLNTVQAYNPANNTWTFEANMPTASEGLAAANANGMVYVFGGSNGSGILNTVQLYNPATNTWITEAPMPIASENLAAALGANGLIYVFGGQNGSGYLGTVQAYNPTTNTWTTEAPMPTAGSALAAVAAANGLLYVFGGQNSSGYLNTVEVYDPSTNTWAIAAPMPIASAGLAATAAANGLLYVFGGSNTSSGVLNTVQAYNPATNTWTAEATMPTASANLAATVSANGLLYVFGGQNNNGTILNTVQVYQAPGASGSASTSIAVTSNQAAQIAVASGSGQKTGVNTAFAAPLVAIVTDAFGDPISGIIVTFAGPSSGAGVTFGGDDTATTNAQGQASLIPTANTSAGSYTVTARVSGVATGANFSLTNNPGAAVNIAYTSGSGQSALVKTAFAGPLVATVTDPFGNLVPGVTVTFASLGSGAGVTFNGGNTVTTNAQGQASITATANTSAGPDTVTAVVSGVASSASFTLTNNASPLSSSLPQGYSPAQIQQAYGFDSISFANSVVGDGAGQTIAIVVAYNQPNIASDLQAFDQQFGLPGFNQPGLPTFTIAAPQGAANAPVGGPLGGWGIEASLDVEWAHALAPGANILLVEARSAGTDLYAAVDYARQQPNVSVISMSWGFPEFSGETSYDQYFTTPDGHIGETFIAATGDQGAPGTYPAYSPNVLAVGGTVFSATLDEKGDYPGEAGWNDSGGGISQYESQPSFQTGLVAQSSTARTIPDVSFEAAGGVAVYDSYDDGAGTPWISEAGTSLGAPSWAALIATADQGTTLMGQGTLKGSAVTTALYNIASSADSFGFNAVTSGNNGFAAGSGYNLVTGLGTPKAAALVAGLSGNIGAPTPLTPTGSLFNTSLPTFQWSAVPGAVGYHLVVVNQSTNTTVLNVSVTGATSYTPSGQSFLPGDSYQWYVQAYPVLAGVGAASETVNFTIAAINAPTLNSPANSSTVTTTEPTFSWSPTPEATYYDLTLVDETQGNLEALNVSQVTGDQYTLTTPLLTGHTYQWYVQAYVVYNNVPYPSQFSAANTFSCLFPQGATLLAPVANTTLTTDTPTFQWSAVTGATGYEFSLLDVTTNSPLIADFPVQGTSFTLSVPLTNGHTYEWSVSVAAAATATAAFTVSLPTGGTKTLATPPLSGPSGIITTNQPTFRWSSVIGATGYGLYIFQDGESQSPVGAPVQVTGSTSYAAPPLLNASSPSLSSTPSFLWWVVAYDNSGDVSEPSSSLSFNVSLPGTGLAAPTGLLPGGTVTTYTPTLQWSPVLGADSYTLDLIDETSGTSVLDQNVGNATSYALGFDTVGTGALQAQLTNGHSYLWYVEPIGSTSPFYGPASSDSFNVNVPTVNGALMPISPAAGATVNTDEPTLQWTAVPDAAYYIVSISGSIPFPYYPVSGNTGNESFTLSEPLLNGGTYQWQVTSYVTNGIGTVPGPADDPQEFIIDLPGTPTPTSPSGTVTTATPTFQWLPVSGAAGYDLYVEDTTSSTFVFNGLRVTGTSFSALNAPLTNGHSYQWYVLAFDTSGNIGLPPNPLTFTVSVTIGTPTPGLTGTVNTTTPTFHWSAVAGAAGYYLTVQDTTTGQTILNQLPVVGSTSYTLAVPLTNNDHYEWSVAAFDSAGDVGGEGSASFAIFAPYSPLGSPTPNSPNGTLTTTEPSLSWSSVTNATAYEVDVTDTTPGAAAFVVPPVQVNGTYYTVTSSTLLIAGHTYEWQVLAVDSSAGDESAWSDPVLFTVGSPPAFTSAGSATFAVGIAGSFPVTASGSPSPSLSVSGSTDGLTFNSSTGVLSGTPIATGSYSIVFTATNGVGGNLTQNFTLYVDAPSAITSPNTQTVVVGSAVNFQVVATGFPLPSLSAGGSFDGLTFNPSTGMLSGIPTAIGNYSILFTAANGFGSNATQNFRLTVVNPQPNSVLNPINPPSVADGTSVSFTIPAIAPVSNGSPLPLTFSLNGAPTGMTVNAATGTVTFAPSEWNGQAPGDYTATVTTAVVNNPQTSASESFSVTVGPSSTNQGSGATTQDNINMRTAVAAGVDNSKEYYTDLLDADYLKYVNRLPTQAELTSFWYPNLPIPGQGSAGADFTDQEIEAYFIGSPEYIQDNGGTDQGWIAGMYMSILGRPAQQSEINYWLNQKQADLNSGVSVGDADIAVAKGIVASNASESILVGADYTRYLGRSGSSTEIAYWVNLFQTGYTNEQVIAGFVGSQEFFQDHGSNIVDWLFADYQATLNRLPDLNGFNYWENQL